MDELIFVVENSPEGGFAARALGESIFTEAEDLASLRAQVKEAVRCHFEDGGGPKDHPSPFCAGRSDRRMRLPRDVSGDELAKRLNVFGYQVSRQAGSHLRLTTTEGGQHHITIPRHASLKLGTLAGVLGDVGEHFSLSRDEVIARVFEK